MKSLRTSAGDRKVANRDGRSNVFQQLTGNLVNRFDGDRAEAKEFNPIK